MIRVALIGASGRMGRAIAAAALESPWKDSLRIAAPIGSVSSRQELETGIAAADVVVDFSTAESVRRSNAIPTDGREPSPLAATTQLRQDRMSPLYEAVVEATEENRRVRYQRRGERDGCGVPRLGHARRSADCVTGSARTARSRSRPSP